MILGLDEVGRGCWAGPLVAGAVILDSNLNLKDGPIVLRDSKKMSKRQREVSAEWLRMNAVCGIGWVWPKEIDSLGLTEAVRLAMERALAEITVDYDELIIDGNINYFPTNPKAKELVKADASVRAVSAASIIAKVARDDYMASLGDQYSGYGFEKHVGYGTTAHITALKTLGISDIHRLSYKPIQALLS